MLGKLISRPFSGNMESPPATPKIDTSVAEQAEQPEETAPPNIPPKPAKFFLPPNDFVIRHLYIIIEIVIPESIDTTTTDANSEMPEESSIFAAPLVITSTNNVGGELRSSKVTNVEKLLTNMKMKNMNKVMRADTMTYLGFMKTL